MLKLFQSIPIPLLLLIATTLEVSGDAVVRLALYNSVGVSRLALLGAGALPGLPVCVGGLLIIAGGLIITFWPAK
jgi:hypothetical protein